MDLVTLKYGTLILAGLSTNGPSIFHTNRLVMIPADTIEIVQGARERRFATQYEAGSNVVSTVTNTTYTWSADPSGAVWYDGTNAQPYLAIAATNHPTEPVTNEVGFLYRVDDMVARRPWWEATTNRYVWGTYSNYTATGFADTNANGLYTFSDRRLRLSRIGYASPGGDFNATLPTDVYTNAAGYKLYDYGVYFGGVPDFLGGNGYPHRYFDSAQIFSDGSPGFFKYGSPWAVPLVNSDWGSVGRTTTPGALITNYLRGATYIETSVRTNVIGRSLPSVLLVKHAGNLLKDLADGSESGYLDLVSTNAQGRFENYTNALPLLTQSNLWARLAFGTNIAGKVLFSDEQPVSMYPYLPVITNTPVVYSNLLERYQAAGEISQLVALRGVNNAMDSSWIAASNAASTRVGTITQDAEAWSAAGTTNYYLWQSPWTNSVANAKDACAADTPAESQSDAVPRSGTMLECNHDYGGSAEYRATAWARRSKQVVTGLNTNLQPTIDTYVIVAAEGGAFDDQGTGLTPAGLRISIDTGLSPVGTVVTSAWVGITTFPGTWPADVSDPGEGGSASTEAGYIVTDGQIVQDWTPDPGCNELTWRDTSGASWVDAVDFCTQKLYSAAVNSNTVEAPLMGARGAVTAAAGVTNWHAWLTVRAKHLVVSNYSTRLPLDVDFYAQGTNYNPATVGDWTQSTNPVVDLNGVLSATNTLDYYSSASNVSAIATSSVLGSLSMPTWCAEPTVVNGPGRARGFTISDDGWEAVLKPEFEYCTGATP